MQSPPDKGFPGIVREPAARGKGRALSISTFLLAAGVVTEEQVAQGVLSRRETGLRVGETPVESGHLVLGALHANNANQAVERVMNFFPIAAHAQLGGQLALNLRLKIKMEDAGAPGVAAAEAEGAAIPGPNAAGPAFTLKGAKQEEDRAA